MIAVPGATPDTLVPDIVATAVLSLLHTPPKVASVIEIEDPVHTPDKPEMAPTVGSGFTVTTFMAFAVPQLFVTE